MIETRVIKTNRIPKVRRRASTAIFASTERAAGAARLTAARSVKKQRKVRSGRGRAGYLSVSGPPGNPPRTRRGALSKAVRYEMQKQLAGPRAVVGPVASIVGTSMVAHEFGGLYRGQHFDQRPLMAPALKKLEPRLTSFWANTIR